MYYARSLTENYMTFFIALIFIGLAISILINIVISYIKWKRTSKELQKLLNSQTENTKLATTKNAEEAIQRLKESNKKYLCDFIKDITNESNT